MSRRRTPVPQRRVEQTTRSPQAYQTQGARRQVKYAAPKQYAQRAGPRPTARQAMQAIYGGPRVGPSAPAQYLQQLGARGWQHAPMQQIMSGYRRPQGVQAAPKRQFRKANPMCEVNNPRDCREENACRWGVNNLTGQETCISFPRSGISKSHCTTARSPQQCAQMPDCKLTKNNVCRIATQRLPEGAEPAPYGFRSSCADLSAQQCATTEGCHPVRSTSYTNKRGTPVNKRAGCAADRYQALEMGSGGPRYAAAGYAPTAGKGSKRQRQPSYYNYPPEEEYYTEY